MNVSFVLAPTSYTCLIYFIYFFISIQTVPPPSSLGNHSSDEWVACLFDREFNIEITNMFCQPAKEEYSHMSNGNHLCGGMKPWQETT